MPQRIRLEPNLIDDELHDLCRCADNPVERSHWRFLWLLDDGLLAYSPELQPAEQLRPLTNTVLANRRFATDDDLEGAQTANCVELQAQSNLIRSTTRFPCWPQRIKKRQGPNSNELLTPTSRRSDTLGEWQTP